MFSLFFLGCIGVALAVDLAGDMVQLFQRPAIRSLICGFVDDIVAKENCALRATGQ